MRSPLNVESGILKKKYERVKSNKNVQAHHVEAGPKIVYLLWITDKDQNHRPLN